MLEEVGVPYERRFVDFAAGEHKQDDFLALNPMGKLPVLTDGDALVTESAAIALYLADRYAPGRLAPALDDAKRGTYLRWSFFSPSVIEPGLMARAAGWTYKDSQAGWGNYQSMLAAMTTAIADRQFLLGNEFSMADVVFGGTVAYMLQFGTLEPLPVFTAYVKRLGERPALQRANAINAAERARLSPAK
jgi:glutathione S-transferase